MSFELVLRKEAQLDLDEIFIWYEEQKIGLGFDFLNEFQNTLLKVNRNPYHTSYIQADAKSAMIKRFPYEVIYRIDEPKMQIRILAVIHQHRDPEWFRKRSRE